MPGNWWPGGIRGTFLVAGVGASGCTGLLFFLPAALVAELDVAQLCPAIYTKWKRTVLLDVGVGSHFGASSFVTDISPCLEMYMVALFMSGKLFFFLDVRIMQLRERQCGGK